MLWNLGDASAEFLILTNQSDHFASVCKHTEKSKDGFNVIGARLWH